MRISVRLYHFKLQKFKKINRNCRLYWKFTALGFDMPFYQCEIRRNIPTTCWSDGEGVRLHILKEENNIDGSKYSFRTSIQPHISNPIHISRAGNFLTKWSLAIQVKKAITYVNPLTINFLTIVMGWCYRKIISWSEYVFREKNFENRNRNSEQKNMSVVLEIIGVMEVKKKQCCQLFIR